MSIMKSVPARRRAAILDTSVVGHPRVVIEISPEEQEMIQADLETLSRLEASVSPQAIVLDALRAAAEQTYFWTPEWQAKEQAADQAIAEGKVQTFDTIEDMLTFLDKQ